MDYKILCLAVGVSALILIRPVLADQININNNTAPAQPAQPTCNNNTTSPSGLRPGTYTRQNGDGSSDTIYTTGDKQPYIVDNNCNSNATAPSSVQPYIFPGPYKGGGGRR